MSTSNSKPLNLRIALDEMEAIQDLFSSLESFNPKNADDAKNKFYELFLSTKEQWLLNGMFDYYIKSGSVRAIDVLICVREPHDRYLLDRLSDTLRGSNKLSALTLLGHIVRKHPSWIYKIAGHAVFKDLIKVLKSEKDVVILMSALLIVVILLPIIASLIAPHLQDLFDIFSHLAVWNTNNPHKVPEIYLLHLEIGMYALFNRLYGMFPCNFLSYLRNHFSSKESLPVFSRTIKPMLDTVRMHPLLVTASKEAETSAHRWKKMESNDVIIECAKFSIESNYDRVKEDCSSRRRSFSVRSKTRFDCYSRPVLETKHSAEGFVEFGNHGVPVINSFSTNLPESSEVWSPAICSGAATPPGGSSIPHTPVIQGVVSSSYSPQSGNSPPEAAIEATPESTPVKDMHEHSERAHSVIGSSVVRSLNAFHSQPSSPLRKENLPMKLCSTPTSLQRVNRIVSERTQAENMVFKGKSTYPPCSPLRVIPQLEKQRPHTPGDRSDEDREVESTMTTSSQVITDFRQVVREDSVLGETNDNGEGGEWREWREGGDLQMPESRTINHLARRLRCFSQCQPENFQLMPIGLTASGSSPNESLKLLTIKLRKTSSCPDLQRPKDSEKKKLKDRENSVKVRLAEKTYVSIGMQTEPLVYEHLLLSILPPMEQIQQHSAPPDVTSPPSFQDEHIISSPRGALDAYIDSTMKSLKEKRGVEASELQQLRDQLILLTLQLQFERHRREVHAERNRRLLGRYRENRGLEEHNSALRDQVDLLQREIEMLHNELNRFKKEAKVNTEKQEKSLTYWEEQNSTLQQKYLESTEKIKALNEDLKEEKRKKETIAEGYAKLESEVFGLRNKMEDALVAVQRAELMKSELAVHQHQLASAGELEARLWSWVNDLLLTSHRGAQAHLVTRTYQHQITEMQKKLDSDGMYKEASHEKLKQAEDLYAKREALAAEQEVLIQAIKDNYEKQVKENEGECLKLHKLNTQREVEILRLQAEVENLQDKLKRLSITKPVTKGPAPELPPINTGGLITEEITHLQNLHLLVENTEGGPSTSRDAPSPP
uniref:Tuberous sclerosis protein product-1 n=1 Tax=Pyrrhocoris apterus TaxID=37000 RepID=A0AAU7B972_PYRAP